MVKESFTPLVPGFRVGIHGGHDRGLDPDGPAPGTSHRSDTIAIFDSATPGSEGMGRS